MKLFCFCLLSLAITTMAEEKSLDELIHVGNNKLTANMFNEVAKLNPDKSIVLSAFSVMPPLAQLALASVGESHDELLESIEMPNDNLTKAAFSSMNSKLRSAKGITLKTASKIYVAEKYDLNPEFAEVSRDNFGSEVQKINFVQNKNAADQINAWVEEQTNHRIKDLIDPDNLDVNSRAILVNAIYFKGAWKKPFKKQLTTKKKFHVSKSNDIEIPMMSRTGNYRYAKSKGLLAEILEIPYEGDESSFVVVLPHDVDGIKQLEKEFGKPATLNEIKSNLQFKNVDVTLPKFKIETTTDLKAILQKIKVTKMFSAHTARLDKLIKDTGDLYIDSATQKAFIEVNEEGAEAAAANQFGVAYLSAFVPAPAIKFTADHPFLFFLFHNNNIIFNGAYYG